MESGTTPTLTVAVVSHKPYKVPTDPIYLPLHVGADLHPDILTDWVQDNTGDNISARNATYSELTGLYWLWKNCSSDYVGIVHYRRLLGTANWARRHTTRDRIDRVVGGDELLALLRDSDIILPRRRNYFIETIYSHYSHTFEGTQLDVTRDIIAEKEPDYLDAFDRVMGSRSAHMFNMFVMSREKLGDYCSWLFPILEELEARLGHDGDDDFAARYPGRVSERLIDVWVGTHGYDYRELPVVSPEPVDWLAKGAGFLRAKFTGRKYGRSF